MRELEFCKKCKKKNFDLNRGIVCGLTDAKPSFVDTCPEYDSVETVSAYRPTVYKPNGDRAKTLVTLLWIVLSLNFLSLISSALQYDLLYSASHGGEVSAFAASANDIREQIVSVLYIVAFVASAVAFIMWFRRAYFNLHQRVSGLTYSEGWAAGCWFVPIFNFYGPYLIMKELYIETKRYLSDRAEPSISTLTTRHLGVWWTFWILDRFFGQVVFRLSQGADTMPEFMKLTLWSIASSLVGLVLGLVTIRVIKDYSRVEGLLAHGQPQPAADIH